MSYIVEQFDVEVFDQEFAELDADLVELSKLEGDFSEEGDDDLQSLDAELEAAGLGEATMAQSVSPLTENAIEMAFLGGFLKRKAARLIHKLYGYVRRYSKCKKCVSLLLSAVAAFKSGRFGTALYRAHRTYRCIRSCARR